MMTPSPVPSDMSPERRAEIAERCAKATAKYQDGRNGTANVVYYNGLDIRPVATVFDEKDRDFILHARQDLPDLLAALAAAEARANKMKAIIEDGAAAIERLPSVGNAVAVLEKFRAAPAPAAPAAKKEQSNGNV